jgi:branched-chain amino acid transport system permease protein
VLVYRATTHINFAHGELFMMGGFFAFSLITYVHLPYFIALIITIPLTFLLGVISDRVVYRPLMRAPGLTLVLATVGFSYLLKGVGRFFWGGKGEYLSIPAIVDPAPIFLGKIPILPQQIIVLGAAIALIAGFGVFFRYTTAGKMMEATAQNTTAAYLVGIRVKDVYTLTWGASAALAGAAAVLMAPLTLLTPDMGLNLLLKAFAATILGGLGSMPGALIGGFIVGISESLAGGYIDTAFQEVSSFIVIIIVLVLRPTGLFGARAVRRA